MRAGDLALHKDKQWGVIERVEGIFISVFYLPGNSKNKAQYGTQYVIWNKPDIIASVKRGTGCTV